MTNPAESPADGRVTVTDAEREGYSESAPLLFKLARLWTRYGPRAKGAVPRKVGRKCLSKMRCFVRTEAGALLAAHPGNLDVAAHIWAHRGTYEPQIVDACFGLIRDGESVLDIGANVGFISLDLIARCNAAGKAISVAAFEPQPELARKIEISRLANAYENLSVWNLLLGDEDGTRELFIPAHAIHASVISRSDDAESVTCPIRRLDGMLDTGDVPAPALIKIDVEGAEMIVFSGASKLLSEHQPTIVFESDANMERFDYSRADLFKVFTDAGEYEFLRILDDRSGCIEIASGTDPNTLPDGNYVALSPRHAERKAGMLAG